MNTLLSEVLQLLPYIRRRFFPKKNNKSPHDDGINILADKELAYEECDPFMPLRDGDMVFCPSVYDGDTIRLTWKDPAGYNVRSLCRIKGIDTPEMRGKTEREKALALRAKKRLEDIVTGEFVTIRDPGQEKYSRVLSDIEVGEITSVTKYMLDDPEICRPYDGGKKSSWD